MPVNDNLNQIVRDLCHIWDHPDISAEVQIFYSHRLRTSLGLADPINKQIKLNPCLQQAEDKLVESVICHELAHIITFNRFGRRAKPHGHQWRLLMIAAGVEPRTTHPVTQELTRRTTRRFNHICPVCQNQRTARRVMRNWRCKHCATVGLEGNLQIEEIAG